MKGNFVDYLINLCLACWHIFRESAFYMLLGFLVAGILYVFIEPTTIFNYLGRGKIRPVLLAALFGLPLPLCSCGVVPAAAGLRRQGANKGATLSFLISTPESGVDSIAVTYALMDPVMTIFRPMAALFTAVIAGVVENLFGKDASPPLLNTLPTGCACAHGSADCGMVTTASAPAEAGAFGKKALRGLKYAYIELMGDIGRWFVLGVIMAGIISYAVPNHFLDAFSENKLVAMLVMLAVGIPMYVCATASTPIAAALILKGLDPGAALVFLLAGPATNAATLSMVSGLLGKRTMAIYLSVIGICALWMGGVVDIVYNQLGLRASAMAGRAAGFLPASVEFASSIVLALLLAYTMGTHRFKKETAACDCHR
jgi:uncharacterized protein